MKTNIFPEKIKFLGQIFQLRSQEKCNTALECMISSQEFFLNCVWFSIQTKFRHLSKINFRKTE